MNKNKLIFRMPAALGLAMTLTGCNRPSPESLALVPAPAEVKVSGGRFTLSPTTSIQVDASFEAPANFLAATLERSTGLQVSLNPGKSPKPAAIVLKTTHDGNTNSESYKLMVSKETVTIEAATPSGAFYGVQTLLQLFPPEIYGTGQTSRTWSAPCVQIRDEPRFPWRGLLLDVTRHFFSKDEVKRFMDLMAIHKLNRLQLHLTDDQGWRIEIRKYPKLTQVGAWRKDIGFGLDPKSSTAYGSDGRYGGFYSRGDIQELVAYAAERQITLVPEIEMPGHAGAALAAYPQFSCKGEARSTEGGPMGIFCPTEETFAFLSDVLGAVMDEFPGPYVHIGGDEVAKDDWKQCAKCQELMKREGLKTEHELQSYFIRRVEKMIHARGRTMVGWSEIMEGGLAPNAVLMDWIGGAVEAASSGHRVVLSPTTHAYFDYYQAEDRSKEPRAIGGFLPLEKVYAFNPIPENLPPQFAGNILGAQANLWTEYIPSFSQVEYMTYPRACALSEVTWSPAAQRNWQQFSGRLRLHLKRLDNRGVHYRR